MPRRVLYFPLWAGSAIDTSGSRPSEGVSALTAAASFSVPRFDVQMTDNLPSHVVEYGPVSAPIVPPVCRKSP